MSDRASPVPTVAYIFKFDETQAPSDEGAVERSETEGESNKYQTFVISPSVIFLRKTTAPSSEGAYVCAKFSICYIPLVVIYSPISTAAASHRPTLRRRLYRIVRNSLWLSLTHYTTPPFPQKSRSARLFSCKRPHDGSLSLPTFADFGQPLRLSAKGSLYNGAFVSISYSIR